ncbi:hypothetical protein QFZ40_001615 [Arthrobacter pascens]|uniref:hypothetical protein n=1 Tax=Arthrobacter pascens TaxID=1677 RepID=UPI0027892A0E|nr:hypothetical protein [Arthrobacter pascens]MDQ0633706.1 hypothetical protein [Arthrobacter pascens]
MIEPLTITFTLTYVGTLGVAMAMFLGQIIAFTAMLVLAGTLVLLTHGARLIMRRRPGP